MMATLRGDGDYDDGVDEEVPEAPAASGKKRHTDGDSQSSF